MDSQNSNSFNVEDMDDTEFEESPSLEIDSNPTSMREKAARAAEVRLGRDESMSSLTDGNQSSMDLFEEEEEMDQMATQEKEEETEEKLSWCGVPLESIPTLNDDNQALIPVVEAVDHTILIRLPYDPNIGPRPSSKEYTDQWDKDYVKLPCSPQSLYPVKKDLVKRWDVIKKGLSQHIPDIKTLFSVVTSYNHRYASKWSFAGLKELIEKEFEEEETEQFFNNILPKMQKLALNLPELITDPIPLLQQDQAHSITLSQLQIACLLANAFFCTFPRRNAKGKNTEYDNYPDINFNRLFFHKTQRSQEKLKCIINYFTSILKERPQGVVTFTRNSLKAEDFPDWKHSSTPICRLHVDSKGLIDDCDGLLQVDFANKFMGGGVLGLGCVQEEIRFVLCPELILTRLFTEALGRNEALTVTGAQIYNKSKGYASTFEWVGSYTDKTPLDRFGRRLSQLVAIDALHFQRNPNVQYQPHLLIREVQKAYCGYKLHSDVMGIPFGVATGNWGCGAFKGDPRLKVLLQLIACSENERDMAYFTFGDSKLRNDISDIHSFLLENKVTTGALIHTLFKYGKLKRDGKDLYHFIYHDLSNSDSDTDRDSPPIPQESEEKSMPETDKDKALQKTTRSIRDYFKPSNKPKEKRSKQSSSLSNEQINNALQECDEIVAQYKVKSSHKQRSRDSNDNNKKVSSESSKGSKLLDALNKLDGDPT